MARVDLMCGGAAGMFISVALHAAVAAAAVLAFAPEPAPAMVVSAVEVAIVREAPPDAPPPASLGVGAVREVAQAPVVEAPLAQRPAADGARASSDLPTVQTVNADVAPLVVSGPVSAAGAGDVLDPYAAQLWSRIAAHRPRGLRGAGDARVVFGLDRAGRVRFAHIASSSGSPAFDRACLAAIRAAAPYPAPPAMLDEVDLVFEAPMLNQHGG